MGLELTDREKEVLKQALNSYEKNLKNEITKTDDRELKKLLHGEDDVLKGLLKKINGTSA